ncbi:hypothetical protein FQN60_005922 [Etheostoma spectabile]|uniref:Uncharacterized protein n=1 Tax=Etheostoma spectabile TaxID=54343 RepID=A0A5J5CF37_9PERO|nr:hypothetical protein FQN60_005922 [Etheostoma spectabile]
MFSICSPENNSSIHYMHPEPVNNSSMLYTNNTAAPLLITSLTLKPSCIAYITIPESTQQPDVAMSSNHCF